MVFLLPGCGSTAKQPANPVRVTLENHSGQAVTGVLLRFDRAIERADPIGERRFEQLTLRLAPADTLRAEGGRLPVGERAVFAVRGVGGPPRLVEGRWIVDGRFGLALTPKEITEEFDVE